MSDVFERLALLQTGGLPTDKAIIVNRAGNPSVIALLMDAELDVFEVRFSPDPSVFDIMSGGMTHITVSTDELYQIIDLADEARDLWGKLEPYWSDSDSCWIGWEHLSAGNWNPKN